MAHAGLCDLPEENGKHQRSRQDPSLAAFRDETIKFRTDAALPSMLELHRQVVVRIPADSLPGPSSLNGLERRLLLSCLVDADHSDTARHYGQEPDREPAAPRWSERLESLDRYVANLASGRESDPLRAKIYQACREADSSVPIWACDSPVGSGKTTAIMAFLLQAAIALDLRHIFVVLPYTNIIEQSVKTYRKALVLDGEDSEKVVVAHHHQAEFETPDLRYLTTLWDAPIIVTTAVQFFETLGANQTTKLRKLHQLPGSAVFVDEAHAAMPIQLWPFMWDQVNSLAKDWRCRFVLGSGSLARFWEKERILGAKAGSIPSMVPEDLRTLSSTHEGSRVRYTSRTDALTLAELSDWVENCRGPRLVVMNTVQSAAVLALKLGNRGLVTEHLSTALAPVHRKPILQKVMTRLKEQPNSDWALVATSCVEAGVDFSFGTAFRERCRAASLVQIGGRVNRHGERDQGEVWDFISHDPLLTKHPDFRHERDVVELLFQKQMWGQDLTLLMTFALEEEFKRRSKEDKIEELLKKERVGSYPSVAKLTRLIQTDTRLVVIDSNIADAIEDGERIDRRSLVANSVQMWLSKIQKLALKKIGFTDELYRWDYEYDAESIGIMKGVLAQERINRQGYEIV
jgi:CRISPR-associated endonuclease/helicase Cas3